MLLQARSLSASGAQSPEALVLDALILDALILEALILEALILEALILEALILEAATLEAKFADDSPSTLVPPATPVPQRRGGLCNQPPVRRPRAICGALPFSDPLPVLHARLPVGAIQGFERASGFRCASGFAVDFRFPRSGFLNALPVDQFKPVPTGSIQFTLKNIGCT